MLYLSPRQDALVPTTACRAQADGRETYACIAVSKGFITTAQDRAARNRAPVLRVFLLKRPSRKGWIPSRVGPTPAPRRNACFLPRLNEAGFRRPRFYEIAASREPGRIQKGVLLEAPGQKLLSRQALQDLEVDQLPITSASPGDACVYSSDTPCGRHGGWGGFPLRLRRGKHACIVVTPLAGVMGVGRLPTSASHKKR
jgi:hypothetical protein